MGSLIEAAKDPGKRPAIIWDCQQMINAEVSEKRGLTGVAVKAAFKAIRKFKPDILPSALDDLIDDFSIQVDPFWQECQAAGADPRQFFSQRKVDIANALLAITDDRAAVSRHRTLIKAYNSMRGTAVNHIGSAMPRFSDIVARHAS